MAKKRYTVASKKKRYSTYRKKTSLRAQYAGGKLLGVFQTPIGHRMTARVNRAKWALPRLRW